jgi:fused signal recognition particle receptor
MGLFEKFRAGLRKTALQLSSRLETVFGASAGLSKSDLKEMEEGLVSVDVGAAMARSLAEEVRQRVSREGAPHPESIRLYLREAVFRRLAAAHKSLELPRPAVVLLAGVNGAGKTTTAGKLAVRFSKEGRKVLLAAGDTFRAAAEEQLTEWAGRAKVELIRGSHGAAPSSVVFDALKSGLSRGVDCLLVDTAGRLHNRSNLMEELRKITRVAEKTAPGIHLEKWLVLDSNTGQNALSQGREFHKEMDLTGIVLTKLDGTAKGGVAVALCEQLGLPIRFLGVGEGPEDLILFDPKMFSEALVPDRAGNT